MAYDLIVTGFQSGKPGTKARAKLQKLVDRSGAAAWGQQSEAFGIGMGRLPEKKAMRFYASLVKQAASAGLTVHDPQAGVMVDLDLPGALPPGWAPPEPADPKQFAAAVTQYARERLEPLGYLSYPWGAQRYTDEGHLLQRITFRCTKDLFTVLVDWRFIFDGREDESWPAPIDIGDYIAGTPLENEWPVALRKPRWGQLSAAASDLEASFAHVDRALTTLVHPLLDSIHTIEKLVAAFEDGRLGTVARQMKENERPLRDAFYMAFGYSPIATARNMASSYRRIGRLAEGKRRYEACLADLGNPASHMRDADKKKLALAEALFG